MHARKIALLTDFGNNIERNMDDLSVNNRFMLRLKRSFQKLKRDDY